MALETLKGLTKLGEVKIATVDKIHDRKNTVNFIEVDHSNNSILFQIQDGPIKENGLNGCQVTDMIAVAKHIIEGLQEKFPCVENEDTIESLNRALDSQRRRTANRESRNVEGTSQE